MWVTDTSLMPRKIPYQRAPVMMLFNEDGSLNTLLTDDILIQLTPLDENGNPNGALGPQNVLNGAGTLIPDPPTSSLW